MCLRGQRKPERRADAFLAFDAHLPSVTFRKRLHDGETQARAALFLSIGFSLVEDFFEKLFADSRPVVADPALDRTFLAMFACPDDNLAAWGVLNRVGNQVLKDAPQ